LAQACRSFAAFGVARFDIQEISLSSKLKIKMKPQKDPKKVDEKDKRK
jgi:hypothetical protein